MFLYTWQAGIFFKIPTKFEKQDHELRFTYARKNHFPTMAQRYSTRFGRSLPNPHLGPEKANHFELGYAGSFGSLGKVISAFNVNAAVYYSFLTGKIVSIQLGNPHYPSALVDYSRNLDATDFYGFELSSELSIMDYVNIGIAFSLNQYHIRRTQDGIQSISYYPPVTTNAYVQVHPVKWLTILPRIEFLSSRFVDTEAKDKLRSYFLTHLKITADVTKYYSFSIGVENIFDVYYEIRQYSPMAGRSFSVNFTARY
jgi:iron complex outermembrane receptor protein